MKPVVGGVVGDEAEHGFVTAHETQDGNETIDDAEDAEVILCGSLTGPGGEEGGQPAENVHKVVRRVDVKDAQEMAVFCDARNETEQTNCKEHYAEDRRHFPNHKPLKNLSD